MVFQKQRVLGQAEEVSTGNLGCRSKLPADWHFQNELVGLVGSHKMDMWPWSPLEGANAPGQKLCWISWSFTLGAGFARKVVGDTQGI